MDNAVYINENAENLKELFNKNMYNPTNPSNIDDDSTKKSKEKLKILYNTMIEPIMIEMSFSEVGNYLNK